ncbi:MAG: MtnX-like HAD-IB family phosphatase [Endomicrobia bacterium]|nr:MtnX-like HAD-IB family phosphatase [Endomicrobiia bacterium]
MKKIAFVSDFDGTITKEDFFNMAVDRLLTPDDLKPWRDYLDKKITHYQALDGIFSKIRIPQNELEDFIQTIEIDPYFTQTLDLCKNLSIPIYICSAGMDYYILKRIPREIEKYNITLLSNKGEYSPETGFKLTPPSSDHMFYNKNTGISKEALVEYLKKQGFFTIYAGDGIPDIKSAQIADAVFAKSVLLELCQKQNIKTLKFDDFRDITEYIKDKVQSSK